MRTVTALVLALVSTPAFAGGASADALTELREQELPQIAETGITAFDSVFMKAKAIHDTLDSVQNRILGAQDRVALALGLPEGTPIRMSMWELKQKAGGPVNVEMRDGKPYLTLSGAGSQEGKAMLESVNSAANDLVGIPQDLAKLPAQVQELVAACQAFPGQLNPQLLAEAGMKPLELPKVAKTLGQNVKAVVATPKRIDGLITASKDLLTGIPQGLAATEPPTEPVQLAKGDKGGKEKAPKAQKTSGASAMVAEAGGFADDIPGTPIGAMVGDALAAFHDAEVESAVRLLGDADGALTRLRSPVPVSELETLYQTAALVHLVDGNAAAATASVAQALVVDPLAKPNAELGPEYAKLHKALAKSGIIRSVQVPVSGSGVAYVSGRRIEGGETLTLGAGKHLLQVQQNGQWTSQLVWVTDGFQIQL